MVSPRKITRQEDDKENGLFRTPRKTTRPRRQAASEANAKILGTASSSIELKSLANVSPFNKKKEENPTLTGTKNTRRTRVIKKLELTEHEDIQQNTHTTSRRDLTHGQDTITQCSTNDVGLLHNEPEESAYSDILCTRKNLALSRITNELIGRDKELDKLHDMITKAILDNTSLSMYLSGTPGTGKTASVQFTIRRIKLEYPKVQSVYLNCMNIRTPNGLRKLLLHSIGYNAIKSASNVQVENALKIVDNSIIIVLDEIDNLETKYHEILYTAFGWPSLPNSKVILIGIANSLDLTERLLPKLKLCRGSRPTLIQFNPYSNDIVAKIISSKLKEATSIMSASAIQYLSRKISANSGDVRKALEVARLALDEATFVHQAKNQPIESKDDSSAQAMSMSVGVAEVVRTINSVYAPQSKKTTSKLPLHAKLLFVAAIHLGEKNENTFPLSKLVNVYLRACYFAKVTPFENTQIIQACEVLDSHGILASLQQRQRPTTPMRAQNTNTYGKKQPTYRLLMETKGARLALDDANLITNVLQNL